MKATAPEKMMPSERASKMRECERRMEQQKIKMEDRSRFVDRVFGQRQNRIDRTEPSCSLASAGDNHVKTFQLSLVPEKLWQAINPWTFIKEGVQFGFINVNLGQTPHPEVEQTILDDVGSYGRQLGRFGDALEVKLNHVKLDGLSQAEKDALTVLKGQLAAVRQVKKPNSTSAERLCLVKNLRCGRSISTVALSYFASPNVRFKRNMAFCGANVCL